MRDLAKLSTLPTTRSTATPLAPTPVRTLQPGWFDDDARADFASRRVLEVARRSDAASSSARARAAPPAAAQGAGYTCGCGRGARRRARASDRRTRRPAARAARAVPASARSSRRPPPAGRRTTPRPRRPRRRRRRRSTRPEIGAPRSALCRRRSGVSAQCRPRCWPGSQRGGANSAGTAAVRPSQKLIGLIAVHKKKVVLLRKIPGFYHTLAKNNQNSRCPRSDLDSRAA